MVRAHSGLLQHMHRPLKRNLIVGTHSRKTRYGWVHGFKIHKVERILEGLRNSLPSVLG
jgi:hypothetical protein